MLETPDKSNGGLTAEFGEQRFVRSRSVVSRVVAGETLIVPVRGKVGDLASIYSFNGTGSLIWQLLDSPRTFPEMVDAVEREYDVEREQAQKDVAQFLNDLFSMELAEVRANAAQIETEAVGAEMPEQALTRAITSQHAQT
jgi:Coenzyme PQQ synthesis protein D (PqqD)